MNYIKVCNRLVIILSIVLSDVGQCYANEKTFEPNPALLMPAPKPKSVKHDPERTLSFSFREEPLVDIIGMVAAERGINIVMPAGADAITSKVTLHMDELLTVDAAWDMLHTILDAAGYSIVLRGSMYAIVKNSKALIKEPVPLYINVPADELPNTDQRIRYLYYLSNIKVSEDPTSELDIVLQSILSETGTYKTDMRTNGVLIIDKADTVKAIMKVVAALDQTSFREKLEILKLHHVSAAIIASLFEENILKTDRDAQRYGLRDRRPMEEANYFSRQLRAIPEPRTNTLILVGREQAVVRVKEFIEKYLDVELDSGQSILHVYQLQYLDAAALAPVLESIVKSTRMQGTGQATTELLQVGTERFFEGVIIKTDKPQGGAGGGGEGEVKYSGGNKLIIAAKNDDWKVIKPIIEELDKPQRTVILEVLIVDLTAVDARELGTSIRNLAALPVPKGVSMQTVHATPQSILNGLDQNPPAITVANSTLATDLLQKNLFPAPPIPGGASTTVADLAFPGTTVLSFSDSSDGETWGIMKLLQTFRHSKILSHPHVVATNNKEAKIIIGEQRLLQGEAVSAVAPIVKKTPESANLEVKITPRISSADTVSIKIFIDITEFVEGTSDARITRNFSTLAEVRTGEVLALGGLIRVGTQDGFSETPILSKIPIIGWFFKDRNAVDAKTNLTVFISPTIVEPRLRGGAGEYTLDHLQIAQRYTQEGDTFDSLRDPITRFFFGGSGEDKKVVRSFLAKDEFKLTEAVQSQYGHERGNDKGGKPIVNNKKINNKKKVPLAPVPTAETIQVTQGKGSPKVAPQTVPASKDNRPSDLKKLLEGTENPLLVV